MKRALILSSAAVAVLGGGGLATAYLVADPASATAVGTTIGGLPAGGLDRTQLQAFLTQQPLPSSLNVVLGATRKVVKPADLGLSVDVDATVERALTTSGNAKRFGVLGGGQGKAVEPVLLRDDERLEALVSTLDDVGDLEEQHGDVTWTDGALQVVGPKDGQSVEADAVREVLEGAFSSLPLRPSLQVPVTVEPAHVSAAQLEEVVASARSLLAPGLLLRAGNLERAVPAAELGPQLTVVAEGTGPGHLVKLALRPTAKEELATRLAAALTLAAKEPVLAAPVPTPRLSEKGNTSWTSIPAAVSVVTPGKAGQKVTAEQVLAVLTEDLLAAPRAGALLTLRPTVVEPLNSVAGARQVNAVLGTFTTGFACCPARVTNIRLIARTIDGTLIAPGQSFSLNGIVGRRTAAKGYVDAPFILDGELSTDIGGGVSQFATTTLNAAFFAGVDLNEHKAHSFYISRYPPGREATVNYPGIDLRWTNDTGSPILVRTASTTTSVTVALYGRGDGRTVTATAGARRPVAGRDFRITVFRTISIPGQPVRREDFTTTYNKPPEDH